MIRKSAIWFPFLNALYSVYKIPSISMPETYTSPAISSYFFIKTSYYSEILRMLLQHQFPIFTSHPYLWRGHVIYKTIFLYLQFQ